MDIFAATKEQSVMYSDRAHQIVSAGLLLVGFVVLFLHLSGGRLP